MQAFRSRARQFAGNAPSKLYKALPAVLLGTLFNVLDAVSTGLLVFPSASKSNVFKGLQVQAMSMYIMSTILSQVAMTLGGSFFPGALGAMLIEILPFLRGIGSDILGALGDEHPGLVPTIMVAYALTSFLIGIVFILLGAFKAGKVVAFFPQTVLTGAIGAIGVSLFILGLELVLPESSSSLTLSNAGKLLFGASHLPLLLASCVPAFFLSVSIRSDLLRRCTYGATRHAYYVPIYLLLIAVFFWIVIAGTHQSTESGMTRLAEQGWLFTVDESIKSQHGIGDAWIYWKLFDFTKVELSALKSAITNIVLLVVIGVLNLPIYVPALGFTLDMPFNMNHEFLGQGAANLLAGMTGTVPNILQLSYSVFFSRAGGGRFEAGLVIFLTVVLFLTSSLILPYVPTILASGLTLFLGIELTLEAVWECTGTLVFIEWLVVMTTLIACTFLGFAEGFGVGLGAAAVVYLLMGIKDTHPQTIQLDEKHNDDTIRSLAHDDYCYPMHSRMPSKLDVRNSCLDVADDIESRKFEDSSSSTSQGSTMIEISSRIHLVRLFGYVFFATVPSLESKLSVKKKKEQEEVSRQFFIVDLTNVHRLETAAVHLLRRKSLESSAVTIVFYGVVPNSGVHADFKRGDVQLVFMPHGANSCTDETSKDLLMFEDCQSAIEWCKRQIETLSIASSTASTLTAGSESIEDDMSNEQILSSFGRMFDKEGSDAILSSIPSPPPMEGEETSDKIEMSALERFTAAGGMIRQYVPGQVIIRKNESADRMIFIVYGFVSYEGTTPYSASHPSRLPLRQALAHYSRRALSCVTRRSKSLDRLHFPSSSVVDVPVVCHLGPGDSFGFVNEDKELDSSAWTRSERVIASLHHGCAPCYTIEISKDSVPPLLWPAMKQWALEIAQTWKN